jgi:hypothetical protein
MASIQSVYRSIIGDNVEQSAQDFLERLQEEIKEKEANVGRMLDIDPDVDVGRIFSVFVRCAVNHAHRVVQSKLRTPPRGWNEENAMFFVFTAFAGTSNGLLPADFSGAVAPWEVFEASLAHPAQLSDVPFADIDLGQRRLTNISTIAYAVLLEMGDFS